MCGGHGVFLAWSSLGTSWTGRVSVSIPDGHLVLSWRTPLADCSKGLHSWSSHITPEWLESVPPLCWNFWGPATGLHATLWNAFLKSMKLWNRSRWCCRYFFWLNYWRSVLLCLKPTCFPASSSSALVLSRLRTTRSMILLGWLIRLMVG